MCIVHAAVYWVVPVLSLAEVTSTLTMKAAYFSEASVSKCHITVCHKPDRSSQMISLNLIFKYRH